MVVHGPRVDVCHPYYVQTGKWPPPGYDGLGDASSNGATSVEHKDVELDLEDDGESLDGCSSCAAAERAAAARVTEDRVAPGPKRRRTGCFQVDLRRPAQELGAATGAEAEAGNPPDALPEAPVDPDWPEALRQLAEIMFMRPGELPIASGRYCEQPIAKEITCGLVVAVKVAIRDLFDDKHPRRASISICRSPERPDLQLSQEDWRRRSAICWPTRSAARCSLRQTRAP